MHTAIKVKNDLASICLSDRTLQYGTASLPQHADTRIKMYINLITYDILASAGSNTHILSVTDDISILTQHPTCETAVIQQYFHT